MCAHGPNHAYDCSLLCRVVGMDVVLISKMLSWLLSCARVFPIQKKSCVVFWSVTSALAMPMLRWLEKDPYCKTRSHSLPSKHFQSPPSNLKINVTRNLQVWLDFCRCYKCPTYRCPWWEEILNFHGTTNWIEMP